MKRTIWLIQPATNYKFKIGNRKFNKTLKFLIRSSLRQLLLMKNLLNKNQITHSQILALNKNSMILNLSLNYNCFKKSYNLQAENVALREYTLVNNLKKMAEMEGISANWYQIFQRNGSRSLKKKLKNIIIGWTSRLTNELSRSNLHKKTNYKMEKSHLTLINSAVQAIKIILMRMSVIVQSPMPNKGFHFLISLKNIMKIAIIHKGLKNHKS